MGLTNPPPYTTRRAVTYAVVAIVQMGVIGGIVLALRYLSQSSGASTAMTSSLSHRVGMLAVVVIVLNLIGWAISAAKSSDKIFDLFGTSSFVVLTITSIALSGAFKSIESTGVSSIVVRQLLSSAFIIVWGVRLCKHLFKRVLQRGEDSRFRAVKLQPMLFLIFWTGQMAWAFIVGLPTYLLNVHGAACVAHAVKNGASVESASSIGVVEIVGLCVWLFGFALEVVGDAEKKAFNVNRTDDASKHQFINSGLWNVSRHPNYLGEMVLWFGNALFVAPLFVKCGMNFLAIACAFSPVFTFLLLRFASGVPILERDADKKHGDDAKYQQYKRDVPMLVPTLAGWIRMAKIIIGAESDGQKGAKKAE